MIDYSDVEQLIEQCLTEMDSASMAKYDSDKADRTASLFLKTQIKLSSLIEDIEMKAKFAKNEIARVEGEKYFEHSVIKPGEKKPTENALASYIAKDTYVVKAKNDCSQYESNLRKWNYIMGVLRDGHVYYRNLSKSKNWSE